MHGGAGVAVEPGSIKQHEDKVRQERAKKGGVGGEKAHIHGAACGHVAVLHENHVDFLVEGGQLECYAGKEVRLTFVDAGGALSCLLGIPARYCC